MRGDAALGAGAAGSRSPAAPLSLWAGRGGELRAPARPSPGGRAAHARAAPQEFPLLSSPCGGGCPVTANGAAGGGRCAALPPAPLRGLLGAHLGRARVAAPQETPSLAPGPRAASPRLGRASSPSPPPRGAAEVGAPDRAPSGQPGGTVGRNPEGAGSGPAARCLRLAFPGPGLKPAGARCRLSACFSLVCISPCCPAADRVCKDGCVPAGDGLFDKELACSFLLKCGTTLNPKCSS